MGHATHFLGRLERLSSPQADFALELYRDSELIRFILQRSRLPDGAERVALGLDQRPDGAHIIVTRAGAFVTCLGAGMSTKELPVVTRRQIDHLGSQYEGLHAAIEHSRHQGEFQRLCRNVMEKGNLLSREDFSTMAAMLPIIDTICIQTAADVAREAIKFQQRYTRRRYRRLNDKVESELRHYWASWWAVGHLLTLCGVRGPELTATMTNDTEKQTFFNYTLSQLAMQSRSLPIMLRGCWATARMGRDLVSMAKQYVRDAMCFIELIYHAMPLVVLGLRHRSARAEVQKHLQRTRRTLDQTMDASDSAISDQLLEAFDQLFEPDGAKRWMDVHRVIGTKRVLLMGQSFPEGHPQRYETPEDVPDELIMAMPMYFDDDIFRDFDKFVILMFTVLPWLATADATEFYLPAQMLDAYTTHYGPWRPQTTLAQLDSWHRYSLRDQPIRAESTPGRNDPCPCNSGKKYKRCCGA
jgi:hypothetical protein